MHAVPATCTSGSRLSTCLPCRAWRGYLQKLKVPDDSSVTLRSWTRQQVAAAKFDAKGELEEEEEEQQE